MRLAKPLMSIVVAAAVASTLISWVACSHPAEAVNNTTCQQEVAEPQKSPARLLFAGDMMQHGPQINAAFVSDSVSYDYSLYFKYIGEPSKNADLAICNLEVTLGGKPYSGYPAFSAPDDYLDAIASAGYDVFLTANNHCLDRGRKGLERTIAKLRDANLAQIGTFEDSLDRSLRYPSITDVNGQKIVLLNYTYGTNGLKPSGGNIVNYIDTAIIASDIATARSLNPDFIIACVHWGVENVFTPNADQKSLARWLVSNGVDHVIGAHPHVVQPAEVITTPDGRRHVVVYSLGNVISNMRSPGNDGGILFGITLDSDNYNLAADSAWWVPYHVAKPRISGLANYTAFPAGCDTALIPKKIISQYNKSIEDTRNVMSRGAALTERSCKDWHWGMPQRQKTTNN